MISTFEGAEAFLFLTVYKFLDLLAQLVMEYLTPKVITSMTSALTEQKASGQDIDCGKFVKRIQHSSSIQGVVCESICRYGR